MFMERSVIVGVRRNTLGSEVDFTDRTVQQVIERVKEDLTKEKDRQSELERQKAT